MKDSNSDPQAAGPTNPYRVLLHKLTGVGIAKPRCKPAANIWRKMNRDVIEAEVRSRASAEQTNPKKLAPLRETIIKRLFSDLPQEEQLDWARLAKEEHAEAVKKWKDDIVGPPSTDPEDRQR